jgi:ABC-type lipoprotein release transport system permease subunit
MPVAIVSSALARHAWPDSSAVGRRLKFGGADSPAPWMTVVGVADDVRYRDVASPPPAIYVPLRQSPFPPRFLVLRTTVDDPAILALARQAVREIDDSQPVIEAASFKDLFAAQMAQPRFQAGAVGLFSGVAVLLAGLGVFSILSTFVAQRMRELGLRMALGADHADLRRFVLSQLGWPAAVGLAAGTWAALLVAPIVGPLLFQVSTLDVRAFAIAWVMLAATTAGAAIVPLRRAMRVDPARLLRSET